MKNRFIFAIVMVLIISSKSCKHSEYEYDSYQDFLQQESDIVPENHFEQACLPINIRNLTIIANLDTIEIWKTGYWHNKLLNEYSKIASPPSICDCDRLQYISNAIQGIGLFFSEDAQDYIDFSSEFDCNQSEWLLFSCNADLVLQSSLAIKKLKLQIDTMPIFSVEERHLMAQIIEYAEAGFNSQEEKESLISNWENLPEKFLDGIVSGGMISILLYSDCFWQDFSISNTTAAIEFRWINIALSDLAGGALSFIHDGVRGDWSGENHDPEAGLRYLKRAGMNALRASAGPFGVLF